MIISHNSNILFSLLISIMYHSFSFEILQFINILYCYIYLQLKLNENQTNNYKPITLQNNHIIVNRRELIINTYKINKKISNKWIEMKNNNNNKHYTFNILKNK